MRGLSFICGDGYKSFHSRLCLHAETSNSSVFWFGVKCFLPVCVKKYSTVALLEEFGEYSRGQCTSIVHFKFENPWSATNWELLWAIKRNTYVPHVLSVRKTCYQGLFLATENHLALSWEKLISFFSWRMHVPSTSFKVIWL